MTICCARSATARWSWSNATHGSRTDRSVSARDTALEHAFARRDASAYEAAYARYGGRLYAAARRLLRDDGAAQDCVHDVLLRLWQRGTSYTSDRGSLEAFLVTCVRNEALARLRSGSRHAAIERSLSIEEGYDDVEDDPVEREHIARAVANLTPVQRQMIEYAYFRAMTLREISDQLQKPLGTVKSHLAAALRALRIALRDEDSRHA